jgi:site-specific DNA recombinase
MKAVIYTRVSGDDQVEGTSLAYQEERCRHYCAERGFEVVEVFREEGETAKDLSLSNRVRFLAALEFCRKRQPAVDALVVLKVDRFARNTEDHFAVRRILQGHGTTLHSVTEPIGNRPAEKFIETVLAGAAEFDNAIRKERCTAGMAARIKQGIWPFKPPIGYACARHRLRGEKKTKPDEPDGPLFSLIRKALLAYANGQIALQSDLAKQLDLWGYRELTGAIATTQLVDRLLGRYLPFYAGILVDPWTGAEYKGLHEAMITSEDAQRIRARRFGLVPGTPIRRMYFNADFPLRRIVKCGMCERPLTAAHSSGNGGRYGYYYCHNRECPRRNKGIRSDELTRAMGRWFRRFELRAHHDLVAKRLDQLWRARKSTSQSTSASQIDALTERRKRICEMREDGSYDLPTYKARVAEVDAQIVKLRAQSVARSIGDLDFDVVLEAAQWFLPRLRELWRQISPSSRARFEQLVFPDGITCDLGAVFRTNNPGLILALVDQKSTPIPHEVHPDGLRPNQEYDYFKALIAWYREENPAEARTKVA